MGKKPVVKLRVYKGSKMSYDENGKVQNENQIVTITHDTIEWINFLKNFKTNAFVKVEVESAVLIDKVKEDGFFVDNISKYDDIDKIKKEVSEAFSPISVIELTPDQKRIADLEAKIEALLGNKEVVTEKQSEIIIEPIKEEKPKTLAELREEYNSLSEKGVFNGWNEEQLIEKIAEMKANK